MTSPSWKTKVLDSRNLAYDAAIVNVDLFWVILFIENDVTYSSIEMAVREVVRVLLILMFGFVARRKLRNS